MKGSLATALIGLVSLAVLMLHLVRSAYGIIAAHYHPASDLAPSAPVTFVAALAAVLAGLGIAIRHVWSQPPPAVALRSWLILATLLFMVDQTVKPLMRAPSHVVVTQGETAFLVHRHYGHSSDKTIPASHELTLDTCLLTGRPKYAARCPHLKGTPPNHYMGLTQGDITSHHYVALDLRHIAHLFEGDRVVAEDALKGLRAVSKGGRSLVELDKGPIKTLLAVIEDDGSVSRMLSCNMSRNNLEMLGGPWGYCQLVGRTPLGTVATTFIPDDHAAPDIAQIDRAIAAALARFTALRCAAPDCADKRPRRIGWGV